MCIRDRSTDNSRIILALTAIGKDVTNVGGHNLLKGLDSMDYIQTQGINGPIWALIALDSHNYPTSGDVTREKLIQVILDAQLPGGGWNLSGNDADPDMTAMAIQALAPYYKENDAVKAAVDKALDVLSELQLATGGFGSWGTENSESCAQVIVALTALDIDPAKDSRFIKNGLTILDALASYYVDGGGFRHTASGELDGMATEQGYYALAAYYRFLNGQTSLYDMSDVTIQTDTSPATYAAIDGGEAYDILLAPGDPSCFGAAPDLLLNWWYGDNVWMQTRCPWKESAEWQKLHGLMDEALAAEGDEQQKKWNECFDIIADNAVLYPVVHVKTVSASWDDPSTAPNGEALDGFKGIGTTSMSFRGVATVKA